MHLAAIIGDGDFRIDSVHSAATSMPISIGSSTNPASDKNDGLSVGLADVTASLTTIGVALVTPTSAAGTKPGIDVIIF
jgi:hypothetical protein